MIFVSSQRSTRSQSPSAQAAHHLSGHADHSPSERQAPALRETSPSTPFKRAFEGTRRADLHDASPSTPSRRAPVGTQQADLHSAAVTTTSSIAQPEPPRPSSEEKQCVLKQRDRGPAGTPHPEEVATLFSNSRVQHCSAMVAVSFIFSWFLGSTSTRRLKTFLLFRNLRL